MDRPGADPLHPPRRSPDSGIRSFLSARPERSQSHGAHGCVVRNIRRHLRNPLPFVANPGNWRSRLRDCGTFLQKRERGGPRQDAERKRAPKRAQETMPGPGQAECPVPRGRQEQNNYNICKLECQELGPPGAVDLIRLNETKQPNYFDQWPTHVTSCVPS